MPAYFIRFEPSPGEARTNVRAAKKSDLPMVLEAECMIEEDQKRAGIDAAMDAWLQFGDASTYFTVYRGQQIGRWNGSGPIYFDPGAVEACLSHEQVSLQRKGGKTAQKAVSAPVAKRAEKGTEPAPAVSAAVPQIVVSVSDAQIARIAEVVYSRMRQDDRRKSRPIRTRVRRFGQNVALVLGSLLLMHGYDALTLPHAPGAHAATVPNLSAPLDLHVVSKTTNSATYAFNDIPGVTGYQVMEANPGVSPAQIVYTTPASLGWRVGWITTHFTGSRWVWVRAFWNTPSGTQYGPWSNRVQPFTYETWPQVYQQTAVQGSIVKIADTSLIQNGGMLGSGFFAARGYIVTCWHVVRPARTVYQYREPGGAWRSAHLVAYSPGADLALLAPNRAPSPPGLLGGYDNPPRVGQPVADIGYALGQHLRMQYGGVITAVGQTQDVGGYGWLHNMLAMRVGDYKGDSGSPLLNQYGEVVGVVENGPGYKTWTKKAGSFTDGAISLQTLASFLARAVPGQGYRLFSSYGVGMDRAPQ